MRAPGTSCCAGLGSHPGTALVGSSGMGCSYPQSGGVTRACPLAEGDLLCSHFLPQTLLLVLWHHPLPLQTPFVLRALLQLQCTGGLSVV